MTLSKRRIGSTPGPWETGFEPTFTDVRAVTSHRPIASCLTPGNTWPQDRKNAALIALAPELFASLRDLLLQFEAGLLVRNTDSDFGEDWALKAAPAIQALAKAQATVHKVEGIA